MNINKQNPPNNQPVIWFSGEIKTPPFSSEARIEGVIYCDYSKRVNPRHYLNLVRCLALVRDAMN